MSNTASLNHEFQELVFTENMMDFAEWACFNPSGERLFRAARRFRFHSIGKIQGRRIDRVIDLDLNVFFDIDDEFLTKCLETLEPEIDFNEFIYVKSLDCSAISLIRWRDNIEVGAIKMIRREVSMDQIRLARQQSSNIVSLEEFRSAKLMTPQTS